ncbi:hypothetical protein HMPREF1531_00451 [Propionibacterium sp. oral taxon 192 str. F0372]|uniref:aminoglycoside phosphotransferase family protein n=1 Tax=Propionibacterium sp. oral taxon 192 TaxID=671222 RepID=UPI0003543A24|nr:aminoglycoside phosphotransferase family protein [Propionibacterium sp. oral taxon 192]EPH06849.1 hypothetical protein HMPREF1531_00451 [Propionibacterium sp. oral taxon 192 str. F0372]
MMVRNIEATTRGIVEMVCDSEHLTACLGQPVTATRIRIKPGSSVAVAASGASDAAWLRFLWPRAHRKGLGVLGWARTHGLQVHQQELGNGILLQWGGLDTDPALAPYLWQVIRGAAGGGTGEILLKHNPLRRVVLRCGGVVVRTTVAPQTPGPDFDAFLGAHLPVPLRLDDGSDPHTSIRCFVAGSDLLADPDPSTAGAVGALLAGLHACGDALPPRIAEELRRRCDDPAASMLANAGIIRELDERLAERIRRLAPLIPGSLGPTVLCHGDASPDQVLHDPGSGELWLTDFDRACWGAAADDLGSYLTAVDEETGDRLVEGYRCAGGMAGPDALRAGIARRLARRVGEPLRSANPEWRRQIAEHLDRLEEVLSCLP